MIRRTAQIVLEILAGLVAVAAILAGFAAWRLSAGPVALDFLDPYIERALSRPGIAVEVGAVDIAWRGWSRAFDVRARDIRIVAAEATSGAEIPELAIRFSAEALLHGVIAPTRIEAIRPRVSVVRRPGEVLDLAVGAGEGAALAPLLSALTVPPKPGDALGYLREVVISDADMSLLDRVAGLDLHAPRADLAVRRRAGGLEGSFAIELRLADGLARLDGEARYAGGDEAVEATVRFSEIDPQALAHEFRPLALLANLRTELSGEAAARLDTTGRVETAELRLDGGAGTLSLPELDDRPLPFESLAAELAWRGDDGRLDLRSLAFDLGGPRATVSGHVVGLGGLAHAQLLAELSGMPVERLPTFWPERVGRDARDWVLGHLEGGTATNAYLVAQGRLAGLDPTGLTVTALSGRIDYEGVTVHYFKPLPPVRAVSGRAEFDAKTFNLFIAGGTIRRTRVLGGEIRITGLDVKDQDIDIQLPIGGPLADALAVLDSPPLGYARELRLDPATVKGMAGARLHFQFPLEKKLTLKQVKIAAAANLRDVALRAVALGEDLTDGDFRLTLDGRGMTVAGEARLKGLPVAIEAERTFQDGGPFQERVQLRAKATAAELAPLGFDLTAVAEGPVGVAIELTETAGRAGRLLARLDLADAAMALRPLGWSKPPGAPGRARLDLSTRDGKPVRLDALVAEAEGLVLLARAELDPASGRPGRVTVDRLRAGGSDLSARATLLPGGGWEVDMHGAAFDLRPLLGGGAAEEGEEGPPGPPLRIAARFDRLVVADAGPGLRQAAVVLDHDGRRLGTVSGEARLEGAEGEGEAAIVSLSLVPRGRMHAMHLAAGDAGALLRALDVADTMVGGTLAFDGTYAGEAPDRPIVGRLSIGDFGIVRAPTLAQILNLASLTGIVAALQGPGIRFTELSGDLIISERHVAVPQLHAYGPSIGVSVEGEIDRNTDSLALSGTVAPVYLLSQIIDQIPILGRLITGGEGRGLLAANYRVTGSVDRPSVTVNPLTALAPGFLRGFAAAFARPPGAPPLPEGAAPPLVDR